MAASGAFVDATDSAAILAQLNTLAVAGNLVIVIPAGSKVWLGKHV
jgi:hypothetical protein